MDREKTFPVSSKRSLQTPAPETSPSKRPKTLPPDSSYSKCIDNVSNGSEAADSESQSCGICLSEDGKAIRGWIDSCDHFFCFVCIIEWAKVESRCPMCKRRFTTIRRPPRDSLFLSERVVNIPVRDQVYHYSGNATLGPPDPYLEVQCTVCNSSADEGLLLLCDLCDSAAHTFCVGLGATVPEGDWFCQDCTVSKAEHDKSETDADCDNQTSFKNILVRPSTEAYVSIFDVVRESSFSEVERPFTRALPHLNELSPSVSERNPADGMTEQSSRTHPAAAPVATEFSARTLRRCRDVHAHVQALRENWNALRSGSLGFSSSLVGCNDTNERRGNGEPHSTPCSSQQLAAEDGSSFDRIRNRSLYDVDKAWRMMDAAKSMGKAYGKTKTVRQASKLSITPAVKANVSSNILASSSRSLGWRNHANDGAQKDYLCHSDVKDNEKHKSEIMVKQKQSITCIGRISKRGENSQSPRSPGKHELPSSRKVQPSINGKLLREDVIAPSNVCDEHYRSFHLTSPSRSVTAASSTSCAKLGMELPNGKAGMKKCGSNCTRDDDAKSEIQSLVKLNLKLLDRDKKLGVDAFKEIARVATHSILAACGKGDPKPGVRSFSGTICRHYTTNQVEQLRMSTLMPTSCRECFFVFVKDVVNTIMYEKIGCTRMSSS